MICYRDRKRFILRNGKNSSINIKVYLLLIEAAKYLLGIYTTFDEIFTFSTVNRFGSHYFLSNQNNRQMFNIYSVFNHKFSFFECLRCLKNNLSWLTKATYKIFNEKFDFFFSFETLI